MEYNKPIAQLNIGDEIEGFYILKNAAIKSSARGNPYLSATISDKTGSVDLKVWGYPGPISTQNEGSVVKIRGAVTDYKGIPQVVAAKIRMAEPNDPYDISTLIPVAPIDQGRSWRGLLDAVNSIEDVDYRNICRWMIDKYGETFKSLPGGKSVHHGFLNGLLMHTLYMTRTARQMADLYSDVVDKNLLIAGTILHDFAKCEEFSISPLGLVADYSVKGQLLGHLVMGAEAVAQAGRELRAPEEKVVLLQHMILSHHGEPEYGAAVRPMCAESELLHIIDLMDSRMEIYREALGEITEGAFSQKIFALGKKIFKHSMSGETLKPSNRMGAMA